MYETAVRLYFRLIDTFERYFFYYLSKVFGNPHPKNLYEYRIREFLSVLKPKDRVADLGSGSGQLCSKMAEKVQYVVGIDLNPPKIKSTPYDYMKLDLRDESLIATLKQKQVNTITLSHVLEHIQDSVGFLTKIKDFEKVLICVPSQENWRFQYKTRLGLDARTDPTHFREYTREMLKTECEQAGLPIQELYYNSEGEIFAVCGQSKG